MSDKDKSTRRGGGFTFLLAFAAFVMSGTALYQQNQDTAVIQGFEAKLKESTVVKGVEAKLASLADRLADAGRRSDLADIREHVSDAMESLLTEESVETMKENITAMNARIEEYLTKLRAEETPDEELIGRVEALKADGEAALATADTDLSGATEKVRGMFREVKKLVRGDEATEGDGRG